MGLMRSVPPLGTLEGIALALFVPYVLIWGMRLRRRFAQRDVGGQDNKS